MTFRKHPEISTEVLDFIAPKVLHALRTASANLTALHIRHAICGGVAVGAYGHIRATTDVDFLSGDEAFIHHGNLVSFAPGVTFAIGGIKTDMVSMSDKGSPNGDMRFLEKELDDPYDLDGMPIVSPEALVAMKLIAHRRKDNDDVLMVLGAGAITKANCLAYLKRHEREDLAARLLRLSDDADDDAEVT